MHLFFSEEQHTRDECLGNKCCWNLIDSTEIPFYLVESVDYLSHAEYAELSVLSILFTLALEYAELHLLHGAPCGVWTLNHQQEKTKSRICITTTPIF